MSRKRLLGVLTLLGAAAVTAGVALIYPPAGLVVAGVFALGAGLLIEDGE